MEYLAHSGSEPMAQLGDLAGCDLFTLDPERGRHLLANTPRAPEEIAGALSDEMARRSEPMPAVLRLRTKTRLAMALHQRLVRPP